MTPEKHIEIKTDLPPFEYCRCYLDSPISTYKVGSKKEIFNNALKMIFYCVENINKENKPHAEFSYGVIEECLNYLTSAAIELSVDFYFGKFIFDFNYLAHNINMNTSNNETIKQKCERLERYSLGKYRFEETIMIFSQLNEKLSKWKTFTPPSFKLSEHYFNLLKEE